MPMERAMCGHPELVPTQWEQKKPEPCLMTMICQCGENQGCPVCHFGWGAIPCSCSRANQGKIEIKVQG